MDQAHYSPQAVSDEILAGIKYSNLHFNIQETPHSLYITIRKKFVIEGSSSPTSQEKLKLDLKVLEEANNALKYDLADEINNHKESKDLIKILEEKIDQIERKFFLECNKLKAKKELFDEVTDKKASAPTVVVNEEKDKLKGVREPDLEKDDNQNLVFSIPTFNKFEILAKPPSTAGLPSSLSLPVSPTQRSTTPSTPKRRTTPSTTLPVSPRTPTLPDQDQLLRSFKKFLEEFKDEKNEKKFFKEAREKLKIQSTLMGVSILDIWHHNKILATEIRANYLKMLPNLKNVLNSFIEENFENTGDKKWNITITNFKAIDIMSLQK